MSTPTDEISRRRVCSECMTEERERGISVYSTVMSFEHDGLASNLLDTPNQRDNRRFGGALIIHAVAIIAC
jgi:peptide subunit release factor RF-3